MPGYHPAQLEERLTALSPQLDMTQGGKFPRFQGGHRGEVTGQDHGIQGMVVSLPPDTFSLALSKSG